MLDHHTALILVPESPDSELFCFTNYLQFAGSLGIRDSFIEHLPELAQYVGYNLKRNDYVFVEKIYVKGVDYSDSNIFKAPWFLNLLESKAPVEIFMINQTKEVQVSAYTFVQENGLGNYVFHFDTQIHTSPVR